MTPGKALTRDAGLSSVDVRNILGENDGKAGLEMEVDVAVEEPRAGVVGGEADGDVVIRLRRARRDDVAPDGVVVVVLARAGTADDSEGML